MPARRAASALAHVAGADDGNLHVVLLLGSRWPKANASVRGGVWRLVDRERTARTRGTEPHEGIESSECCSRRLSARGPAAAHRDSVDNSDPERGKPMNHDALKDDCDRILARCTEGESRVPGVIAIARPTGGGGGGGKRTSTRARGRRARAGPGRADDDGHRLRGLLDDQGRRPAPPACSSSRTAAWTSTRRRRPTPRRSASCRCSRASTPTAPRSCAPRAPRSPTRMLLSHTTGPRLRLLQRGLQAARRRARSAERHHRHEGLDEDAAAVRSRRALGVRLEHRLGRPGRRGLSPASVSGRSCAERILEPLGMHDTAFTMSDAMRSRLARIHQREDDGSLTPAARHGAAPGPRGAHGRRTGSTRRPRTT